MRGQTNTLRPGAVRALFIGRKQLMQEVSRLGSTIEERRSYLEMDEASLAQAKQELAEIEITLLDAGFDLDWEKKTDAGG